MREEKIAFAAVGRGKVGDGSAEKGDENDREVDDIVSRCCEIAAQIDSHHST